MSRRRARLLFVHVPKTAGTALVDLIAREYGEDQLVRIYGGEFGIDLDELRAWPRRQQRAVRAVVGHMVFGLHEELPGPSAYVTVLRDPVDRIVSHHGYVLGEPTLVALHEATGERATLVGHVTGSPHAHLVNDGQTRLLGGDLADAFGWSAVDLPTVNVTPTRRPVDALSAAEQAVVEEHNQLDRVLYDHARAAFDANMGTPAPEEAR